jgi:hypothetical protein
MIKPLRQSHYWIFIALGILLPIAFAVGIAGRKPAPMEVELSTAILPDSTTFHFLEWQRADLFAKSPVQVQLLREQKNAGRLALSFFAAKNFVRPDLIVYWVAGDVAITDALPANAMLLGSFGLPTLPVVNEIAAVNGRLILFSLADGVMVDVSSLISLQSSNNSTQ